MLGWRERLPRLGVLGALLLAHIGVIAMIAVISRKPLPVVQLPQSLIVDLITEQAESEKWSPPLPQPVLTTVSLPAPDVPLIDIPLVVEPIAAAPAPSSAITDVVAAPPKAERGAPQTVSTVEYVREPMPRYPPQSRKLREQGLVMLRVIIDERGAASQVDIERSSGYARLDQAAREAVLRASFRPYNEGGIPQPALVLIPIEFSLSRS